MPRTSTVHAATTIGIDMGKNTLHMGTVRPSAVAVLRLMTRSYFVGCVTGRSDGSAP